MFFFEKEKRRIIKSSKGVCNGCRRSKSADDSIKAGPDQKRPGVEADSVGASSPGPGAPLPGSSGGAPNGGKPRVEGRRNQSGRRQRRGWGPGVAVASFGGRCSCYAPRGWGKAGGPHPGWRPRGRRTGGARGPRQRGAAGAGTIGRQTARAKKRWRRMGAPGS